MQPSATNKASFFTKIKLLTAGGFLLAVSLVWYFWQVQSANALQAQSTKQLQNIAQQRAKALSAFFEVQTAATQSWATQNFDPQGAAQLVASAAKLQSSLNAKVTPQALEAALRDHYTNGFAKRFRATTGSSVGAIQLQVDRLNELGRALQYSLFVEAVPQPNDYATVSEALDQSLTAVIAQRGWTDVMVVDAESAQVLYSHARSIALGTVLTEGPIARTALGELYQNTMSRKSVTLSDVDRHIPALGAEVLFVAAPVLRDQKVTAIAIAQVPAAQVQAIVSNAPVWASLGKTGDVALIGPDHAPRNQSRLMQTEPVAAFNVLQSIVSEATFDAIKITGSEVVLRRVETIGSKAALDETNWTGAYINYARVPVWSAAEKLSVFNQRYGVLVEQHVSELMPPVWFRDFKAPLGLCALGVLMALLGVMKQNRVAAEISPALPSDLSNAQPEKSELSEQLVQEEHTLLVPIPTSPAAQVIPSSITKQLEVNQTEPGNTSATAPPQPTSTQPTATLKLIEQCSMQAKTTQQQWGEILRTLDILEALVARSASVALNASLAANSPDGQTEAAARQLALMTDELRRLSISARECVGQANMLASGQLEQSANLVSLNQQLQLRWRQHEDQLNRKTVRDEAKML